MSGGAVLAQHVPAPATLTPQQQVVDKLTSMFGKVGLPTSADLARKPGSQQVNDWQVVDSAYKDRFLASLSTMVTAAMMNQFWGQPLLAVCTEIVLSWDRQWSVSFKEVYQWAWSEISATGIPHTVQFRTWKETGGMNRYGQYFEIPNATLVDPNFGVDALLEMADAMKTTYDYTIMTKTSMALAMAPMRNMMKRLEAQNMTYSYADHYDYTTRNFCIGSLKSETLIDELDKMLNTMPMKDTVIMPPGHAHTLQGITHQGDRFKYHVKDATDNSILAGIQLRNLETQPINVLTVGDRTVNLITNPDFQSMSPQAEEHREQSLRRRITLARSYVFPDRSYGPLSPLDARGLVVPILNIDRRNATWHPMRMAQVIEETRCGGYFNAAGDYSSGFIQYVESLNANPEQNAQERLTKMVEDMADMADMDHPGRHAAIQIGEYSEAIERPATGPMNLWRELSNFVHIECDETGQAVRAVANKLIVQQHEAMFPTRVAIEQARSALESDREEHHHRNLAGILGCSSATAKVLLTTVEDADLQFNGSEPVQSIAAYRAILEMADVKVNGQKFHEQAKAADKLTAQRKAAAAASDEARKSTARYHGWYRTLPNHAFETMTPFLSALDQLDARAEDASKVVHATIAKRFASHATDAGASALVAQHLAAKLGELGLTPDAAASPSGISVPSNEQLKTFKNAMSSPKEVLAAKRDATHEDFSQSRAYAALQDGAPFAGPITNTDAAKRITKKGDVAARVTDLITKIQGAVPGKKAIEDDVKNLDALYVPEDRLHAMATAFDGCGPQETLVALAILVSAMTPKVLGRLASQGLQMMQGSVERYSEQYIVSSALVMRAGGETVQTVMTPVMAQVSSRGIQKITVFDYIFNLGHKFNSWDGIQEIFGVFPYALGGGTGTLLCRSVEEIREIFMPNKTSRAAPRDGVFVPRPYTERRLEYPGNLFGGLDVVARRAFTPENFFHRKNTGHAVLRAMLGPEFIDMAQANLDSSVIISHAMQPNPYCPMVERAATYYYNEGDNDYSNQASGTGPMGEMKFNNYECISSVMGLGKGTFPDTYPMRANI